MVTGQGSPTTTLDEGQVEAVLDQALASLPVDGNRVLVIIPDSTRTAPLPLIFRLLYRKIGQRATQLDYLIALGTHQPMSDDAIDRHLGVSAAERAERYSNVEVYNHRWDLPEALQQIGTISKAETNLLTGGMLSADVPVVLNKMIFDYDQLIICGPVFPHEVAGFSGGAKYLFGPAHRFSVK